jgi:hypothetical protein
MVQVTALIDPDLLVEIEAEAVVGSGRDDATSPTGVTPP